MPNATLIAAIKYAADEPTVDVLPSARVALVDAGWSPPGDIEEVRGYGSEIVRAVRLPRDEAVYGGPE